MMPNWQAAMGNGATAGSLISPGVGTAVGAGLGLVGGLADNYFSSEAADKAWKRQKKVLQNQVQWRVEDTIAAGLHPLAALGVNPASGPAPATIAGDLQSMGQDIGRAAEAMIDPRNKVLGRDILLDLAQKEANVNYTNAQTLLAKKALLRQGGGGPGIAKDNPLPVDEPRSGKFGYIPTRNVQQGQAAEDYGGDMLGSLIAAVATMDDFIRYNWDSPDLRKNIPDWMNYEDWFK